MASATAPTRSPAAGPRCRSTTSAGSCATASGSASSTPATPGRRRSPGGASARPACRCPRTVTEALAWSRQIAAPTEIAVRPSGRFTEIVSARFAPCLRPLRRLPPRAARLRLVRRRASRSRDPRRDRTRRRLCSRTCQDICHRRRGMIDPTPNEQAAMAAGGDAAGEYLEVPGQVRPRDAQPRRVAAADRDRGHRLLRHPARARGPGPRPARRHGGKDPVLMSDQSFMERFGPRLVANGYPILPIMPGTKKPGRFRNGAWSDYPDWTRHAARPTTEHELEVWRTWPDAGVGIVVRAGRRGRHRHHGCRARARARAALPRPARRHAGAPDRPCAEAAAGLPRGRAVRRHPARAARGAGARPAVRRACHPSRHRPALRVAGRQPGRSRHRALCRRSTRRRCGRSSTRRWRWCRTT